MAIKELIQQFEFVMLQEYWLFNFEQNFLEYIGDVEYIVTSVDDDSSILPTQPPRAMVAIVWKKGTPLRVVKVNEGSNLPIVKIITPNLETLLISAYMPSSGSSIQSQ